VTGALEKKTQAVHIFAFIVATASGFEHVSLDPQHSTSAFAKKTAQLRHADGTYVLLYPSCPDFAQSATRLAMLQGHVKLAFGMLKAVEMRGSCSYKFDYSKRSGQCGGFQIAFNTKHLEDL